MSTTVQIPGGEATIREVSEMTVRQRRTVQASFMTTTHIYARLPEELLAQTSQANEEGLDARQKVSRMLAALPLTQEEAEALLGMQDATIVAFLASWTLPDALPTVATVQDLPPAVYDALAEATKEQGSALVLGTVNAEPTPEGIDSPFDESATSSADSSSQTETTPLTGEPLSDGESSATESSSV
jgi:hypothetical protein